ncbi:MAG: hypothetical protein ACP5FP_07680 [Desulfuromonadaceae bacterium]
MKIKQWLSLFAVLSSILLLAACGSNSGSGGDQSADPAADDLGTDPTTGIEYVGTDKCIGCHDDISWSADIIDAYLMGKHVIHSDHITAADEVDGCLDCHDPIGDGAALEALIDPANVPTEGLAAVGCETCHGAGGDHYGVGPMPNARPEADACAQCHDELPESHLTHHPEANFIASDYFTSGHSGADGRNEAICVKCHNDEGARKYKDVTTWEGLAVTLPIEGTTHAIQCRTCHDPHHAGELLKPSEDSGYPDHILTKSTEYATCTNCHQDADAQLVSLTNEDGTLKTYAEWEADMLDLRAKGISSDQAQGDLIYHASRFERVISSTHFDNPLTESTIEGYVVDPTNEKACRSCHNVHSGNTSINRQWAKSGHAGELLTIKEEVEANDHAMEGAIDIRLTGTVTSWSDHAWPTDDEADCQRCHTATGSKNYFDDPETYKTAMEEFVEAYEADPNTSVENPNDFSYLEDGQQEMLYCWSCHANNSGELRAPGAIEPEYVATNGSDDAIFPDVAGSNVCLACHAGRESGGNIKASDDDFTAKSFVNSHYLPAGGTLYKTVGYEYADAPDYNSHGHFRHDLIGAEEGQNGACVGCHMESEEGHTFSVVEKDDTGSITAITGTSCVGCHDGGHGPAFVAKGGDPNAVLAAAEVLNEEVESFEASIHALAAQLYAAGFPYQGGYPYFGTFAQREVDWTSGGTYNGKDAMGAAFNFNYLHHEPGAYAHNRVYTKKLIYDSIDYLDDATLNESVGATLDSLVGTYLDADEEDTLTQEDVDLAKAYLDGNDEEAGVQRPE